MKASLIYLLTLVILLAGGFTYLQLSGKATNPFHKAEGEAPVVLTAQGESNQLQFKNYGPAPEFYEVSKWLNSEPLAMADLKGKVVLINFWTYSCVNCVRSLPYLEQWQQQYKDQGLVVIGIHTPEYGFEKVTSSLQDVVNRNKVTYPIAQDNSYAMWNAYDNQFWPAVFLVDKEGKIVYSQSGDSSYQLTENAIKNLLSLPGGLAINEQPIQFVDQKPLHQIQFGIKHNDVFSSNELPTEEEQVYTLPEQLRLNALALEGVWKLSNERASLTQGYGRIQLRTIAKRIQLAAQSIKPVTLKIIVDGKTTFEIPVQVQQNYELFSSDKTARHTVEIEIPQAGFEATSFILD